MTERNHKIDVMKFIFSLSILCYHFQLAEAWEKGIALGHHLHFFRKGNIGVEFFFLVSGWLLAASIYKSTKASLREFMKKKWSSIGYTYVLSMFCTITIFVFLFYQSLGERITYVLSTIPSFIWINTLGIGSFSTLSFVWYLGVWFMSSAIIYFGARYNRDLFMQWLFPSVGLLILIYMYWKTGSLFGVSQRFLGLTKCFYRGLAEMMLGVGAYTFTKKLDGFYARLQGYVKTCLWVFLSMIEWTGYFFVLYYANTKWPARLQFACLGLLFFSISISFMQKKRSKLFTWSGFSMFGELSLLVYLNHMWCSYLIAVAMSGWNLWMRLIAEIVLVLSVCVLWIYIKQNLKKISWQGKAR